MTTDLRTFTGPQKRMLLQSHIGDRLRITCSNGVRPPHDATIELIGLAIELTSDPDRATTIVGRMCDEDNRLAIVSLAWVTTLEQLAYYPTDPRSPEYEAPTMTVRPSPNTNRKGSRR